MVQIAYITVSVYVNVEKSQKWPIFTGNVIFSLSSYRHKIFTGNVIFSLSSYRHFCSEFSNEFENYFFHFSFLIFGEKNQLEKKRELKNILKIKPHGHVENKKLTSIVTIILSKINQVTFINI